MTKSISLHLCAGPNDCLVYKDDPVNIIWYIKSGSMEVMEGDMVVAILGAGDLVGCDLEDQLVHPSRNVITRSGYLVKALTYCELKAIQLDHLLEVRLIGFRMNRFKI